MTFHSLIDMIKPISVIKQEVSGMPSEQGDSETRTGRKNQLRENKIKEKKGNRIPTMLPQYFLLAWLLVDGMKYSRALM